MIAIEIFSKSKKEFLDTIKENLDSKKASKDTFITLRGGRGFINESLELLNEELTKTASITNKINPKEYKVNIAFISSIGWITLEYDERDKATKLRCPVYILGGLPYNSYEYTVYLKEGENLIKKQDYSILNQN